MWMAVLQELVHRNMTEEMRHRAQKAEQQAQKDVRQAQGPPSKSLWQASREAPGSKLRCKTGAVEPCLLDCLNAWVPSRTWGWDNPPLRGRALCSSSGFLDSAGFSHRLEVEAAVCPGSRKPGVADADERHDAVV